MIPGFRVTDCRYSCRWDILGQSRDSQDTKYSGSVGIAVGGTSWDNPGIPGILSIQGV